MNPKQNFFLSTLFLTMISCQPTAPNGTGKPDDSNIGTQSTISSTSNSGTTSSCGITVPLPEAPANAGQLAFSLEKDVDPCSVKGYVVGYQSNLSVKMASDGTYFINNVPSGSRDVVIVGSVAITLGTTNLLAGKDRGLRLNGEKFLNGVKNDKGKTPLPEVGSLSGKVTLSGKTDHAGIHVYIPGTGFDATTDINGNYTISPYAPSGFHNLFFEKDGYYRGQAERLEVKPSTETVAPSIELVLSTGSEGFLVINKGVQKTNSRTVALSIGATPDAVLMKISESPTFDNLAWKPIVTSSTYTFDSPGNKKLYVKFANENGLESSPFNASIMVELFGSDEGGISINSAATATNTRVVNLGLSIPVNATQMMICENAQFTGCSWESNSSKKSYTFATEGNKIIYVKYKDKDGFESGVKSASIVVALFGSDEGGISINSAATATNTRAVKLALSIPVNAVQMMICENVQFTGCSWEAISATKSYTFATEGSKIIYVKYKEKDNFESTVKSASIVVALFGSDEGVISVNSAATATSTRTVNLALSIPVNAVQMMICENVQFTGCSWEAISATKLYSFVTDGSKIIYVKYKDKDNFESSVKSASILVDTQAPTFSVTSSYNVRDANMTLNISATDLSSLQMKVAASSSFNSATYQSFASAYSIPYAKNIKIQLKDTLGTESGVLDYSVTYTPTLSQGRQSLAATTVGAKAIFAGGYGFYNSSYSNVVDIYDSTSNTWSTATLSQARQDLAATVVGTKAIFAGGFKSGSTTSNVVDIYDSTSNTWSTATLSQARYRLVATTVGTKAIFAGGAATVNGSSSNVVDIYDSSSNSWTTATLSQGRSWLAATTIGTKAIFAGGRLESSATGSDVVDIYDSTSNTWSTATLSQARQQPGATTVGTKAIFAGGYTGNYSNVIDIFDSQTGTWSTATLSQVRPAVIATTVGTKAIFATGGANSSDVVEIYDSQTGAWSANSLSHSRAYLALTTVGTKVIFYSFDGIEIYDSLTGTWSTSM